MGVFEYSDVDNAGSFALDGKVAGKWSRSPQSPDGHPEKNLARKTQELERPHRNGFDRRTSKDNPLVWEARLQGMAPEIDGKLYLTDIELPDGRLADAGDAAHVEISKSDAYDLIGRVVDILPRASMAA